jgi:sugar lactone lactonase YvrE
LSKNHGARWFAIWMVVAVAFLLQIAPLQASPGVSPEDAKHIMPLSQIKRGMRGYGLTVFHGTKIEKFDVEILGVLKKMNTGKDLILVRIGGGPITSRDTGIIAGMSGSPCYINGKLVGAVAYGSGYAKEPVGMLTPIEDMLEAWDSNLPKQASGYSSPQPLPEPLTIGGKRVAKVSIGSPEAPEKDISDGTLYMRPLMTPLMVSGLSPRGIGKLAEILRPFRIEPIAGPGGGQKPGVSAKLEPGAAVGVSLARGDIDLTAIGTLTYRRGNKIVGFGHPMLGIGAVDAPMTTAFVDDLISSYRVSTKMASPLETVGRVFQDRPWSIAGAVGETAKTIPAAIEIDDRMFGRKRAFNVKVINHPLLASRLLTMVIGEAIYDAHPAPGDATAEVTYEVVADQVGKITRSNTFFDPVSIDGAAITDIGSLLGLLSANRFHPLDIKSVKVKVRILGKRNTATIDRIFVKESEYEPGETVDVGVVLRPYKSDRITKTVSIKIPATAPDGKITLLVRGGGMQPLGPIGGTGGPADEDGGEGPPAGMPSIMGSDLANADNVKQLISKYLEREKNNELVVQLMMRSTAINVAGQKLSGLPTAIADVMKSSRNSGLKMERDEVKQAFQQDYIISGSAMLSLNVKRKDFKESRPTPRGPSSIPEVGADEGPGSSSIPTSLGMDDYSYGMGLRDLITLAEPSVSVAESDADDDEIDSPSPPSDQSSTSAAGKPGDGTSSAAPKSDVKPVVRQAKSWTQRTQADFAKGTFSGVAASSKNKLELAPTLRRLADTPEQFIWCTAPAKDGVYAGTGDSGRVYRFSDSGEAKIFYETGELEVHALARDSAGNLYAGTSPHGRVFKIAPDGKGSLIFEAPEKYILALAIDHEGNLYAGTGDAGKVYRIAPGAEGHEFAVLGEQQVLSLHYDSHGYILAGTGINGVVYKIDKLGKATPIFDANEDSITSIVTDSKENVYAGTSPKGVVYKITPDGRSKPLFTRASRVLSMARDSRDNIYAVSDGTVVRIAPDETTVQLDSAQDKVQFLSLTFNEATGTLYSGTGNIGSVYISKCCEVVGEYESPVHDSGMISRWSRIKWTAEAPEGTTVELRTRTGNVATPDATWSEWSPPYTNAMGEQITGGDARYVQYRVTLKTGKDGATPRVGSVTISYLTPNQAPTVKLLAPGGGEVWSGKETIKWAGTDADKDSLTYDVYYSRDGGKEWKPLVGGVASGVSNGAAAAPDKKLTEKDVLDKVKTELANSEDVPAEMKRDVLKKQPEAAKPSPDSTTSESGTNGESSTKTSHTWDTSGVSDGVYLLKVVASDKISNASGALTGEVISEPFTICNTPPKLTLYRKTMEVNGIGSATISGTAASQLVEITGVQFRVDGGTWTAAAAEDGVFDSLYESFTATTGDLSIGKHKVEIQAIDSAGNATTSAVEVQVSAGN